MSYLTILNLSIISLLSINLQASIVPSVATNQMMNGLIAQINKSFPNIKPVLQTSNIGMFKPTTLCRMQWQYNNKCPYELLGISTTEINLSDLKKAYNAQAKKAHPDAGGSNDAFIKTKDAYDYLTWCIKNNKKHPKYTQTNNNFNSKQAPNEDTESNFNKNKQKSNNDIKYICYNGIRIHIHMLSIIYPTMPEENYTKSYKELVQKNNSFNKKHPDFLQEYQDYKLKKNHVKIKNKYGNDFYLKYEDKNFEIATEYSHKSDKLNHIWHNYCMRQPEYQEQEYEDLRNICLEKYFKLNAEQIRMHQEAYEKHDVKNNHQASNFTKKNTYSHQYEKTSDNKQQSNEYSYNNFKDENIYQDQKLIKTIVFNGLFLTAFFTVFTKLLTESPQAQTPSSR